LVVFANEEEPIDTLRNMQSRIFTDFIVIEGNTMLDIPLDEILDTHRLA